MKQFDNALALLTCPLETAFLDLLETQLDYLEMLYKKSKKKMIILINWSESKVIKHKLGDQSII